MFTRLTSIIASVFGLTVPALAQCPGWSSEFGPRGFGAETVFGSPIQTFLPDVRCQAEFQGSLYVGGLFTSGDSELCSRVARWDGTHWRDAGGGIGGSPSEFVADLCTFDDGSGLALYAGGRFSVAGGVTTNHVARWNGTSWLALPSIGQPIDALASFDAGGGARLYAGGDFNTFGAWNGTSWSSPPQAPGQFIGHIHDFLVANLGAGPRLYISGDVQFSLMSGQHFGVAGWDGSTWEIPGAGLQGTCRTIAVHDDGTGAKLYAGGLITGGSSVPSVARFDGATWQPIGAELQGNVFGLMEWDDGTGTGLLATGSFERTATSAVSGVARWRAGAWGPIGQGLGADDSVHALTTCDMGTGRQLYAGGRFQAIGNARAASVARFDGQAWHALGAGIAGPVYALCEYDEPNRGTSLFVGGAFATAGGQTAIAIARWNGTSWSAVNHGVIGGSVVNALVVHDAGSGPALYVGGTFNNAGQPPGAIAAQFVARWNGTSWSSLGFGMNNTVRALCVHDFGTGPRLVAAGVFSQAGGVAASRVAVWNGSAWAGLGAGSAGGVNALLSFDDGSGPALYSSGYYTLPGGALTNEIARWRAGAWESVGTGITADPATRSVLSLASFSDASGSSLVAGGFFDEAGGNAASSLARWDGTGWSGYGLGAELPGSALNVRVHALCAWDDGSGGGADLFVGGNFTRLDGRPAANIARLRACGPQGIAYCLGDGSGTPCPCGNSGATGHGCANPAQASGARLEATGVPSVSQDTIQLNASGLPNSSAFFVQASSRDGGGLGVPLYDGLRCISGSLIRLGSRAAVNGQASYPSGALIVSLRGAIPPAGATRHYQVLYRSAAPMFCPPATANWTNGLTLTWFP